MAAAVIRVLSTSSPPTSTNAAMLVACGTAAPGCGGRSTAQPDRELSKQAYYKWERRPFPPGTGTRRT
jgi:hypothetical protein